MTADLASDLATDRLRFLAGELALDSPMYSCWRRSGRRDHITVCFNGEPDLDTPLVKYGQRVVDNVIDRWQGPPVCAVLATPDVIVCSRRSVDRDLELRLDRNNLAPGFSFSEQNVASNGLGTAMATLDTAYVLGAGHLADELQDDVCAATIVRDPFTRDVAGIVNLTCRLEDASPHLITFVELAAADISRSLAEDRRAAIPSSA